MPLAVFPWGRLVVFTKDFIKIHLLYPHRIGNFGYGLTGAQQHTGRVPTTSTHCRLLRDYLKKDLTAGGLTLDEAREIFAHFFIKAASGSAVVTTVAAIRGRMGASHHRGRFVYLLTSKTVESN